MMYRSTVAAGLLLGGATGLMIGLSQSPVVGAAVTGVMGVASVFITALYSQPAQDAPRRRTEWLLSCLAGALVVTMGLGIWIRESGETPAERLVRILRDELRIPEAEVAERLVTAVGGAANPGDFLGTDTNVVYASGGISKTAARPIDREAKDRAERCGRVFPPGGAYKDPAFIEKFREQEGQFARVVAAIEGADVPEGPAEGLATKLLMLRAGYAALCEDQ